MRTETARDGQRGRADGTAGGRGPVIRRALVAIAVIAAVVAAWSTPAVREELAKSFTRQDRPYLELYFIELPSYVGDQVEAKVAFTPHGGVRSAGPSAKERAEGAPRPASDTFVLKAEADRDGELLGTGWATVRAVDGQAKVVNVDVALPKGEDADALRVSVAGRSEYVVGHLETAG
ncbi:hypothetical protein [Streptomyces sp. NBC_01669]|uniref:hypothetical protein n=1 Tax=Streptomyces sp. NBC_01669 TaxID=2975909 RepID=UPI0022509CD8|nr:hypothetical protein [Streptomyces sp. NBC_01669]MCX4538323.1 hypothetical protein [Streptomyces sp. NBC_01669]